MFSPCLASLIVCFDFFLLLLAFLFKMMGFLICGAWHLLITTSHLNASKSELKNIRLDWKMIGNKNCNLQENPT